LGIFDPRFAKSRCDFRLAAAPSRAASLTCQVQRCERSRQKIRRMMAKTAIAMNAHGDPPPVSLNAIQPGRTPGSQPMALTDVMVASNTSDCILPPLLTTWRPAAWPK